MPRIGVNYIGIGDMPSPLIGAFGGIDLETRQISLMKKFAFVLALSMVVAGLSMAAEPEILLPGPGGDDRGRRDRRGAAHRGTLPAGRLRERTVRNRPQRQRRRRRELPARRDRCAQRLRAIIDRHVRPADHRHR